MNKVSGGIEIERNGTHVYGRNCDAAEETEDDEEEGVGHSCDEDRTFAPEMSDCGEKEAAEGRTGPALRRLGRE